MREKKFPAVQSSVLRPLYFDRIEILPAKLKKILAATTSATPFPIHPQCLNPLSQVVFFHPFPLRTGGGCIDPPP